MSIANPRPTSGSLGGAHRSQTPSLAKHGPRGRFIFPLTWSIIFLPFLLVPLPASDEARAAESPPFYWDSINVDIDVQENGDMLVTETQKYVFTGPHTNERYRWLRLDKVDRIDRVEVLEAGRSLSALAGVKDNLFWIKWWHTLTPPESHTFVLKYRVQGGLHISPSGDKVYWKALFKDRAAPIQRGIVRGRLPDALAGHIRGFTSFGGATIDKRLLDSQTVEFTLREPLPPGRELEVEASFPHGILAVPVREWKPTARESEFNGIQGVPVANLSAILAKMVSNLRAQPNLMLRKLALGFTFPMLAGFMLLGLVLLRARKWHLMYPDVSDQRTTPPSDLSAPAVSLLESPVVHRGTVLAMVVEMCQRGLLAMEVRGKYTALRKIQDINLTQSVSEDWSWEGSRLGRLAHVRPACAAIRLP